MHCLNPRPNEPLLNNVHVITVEPVKIWTHAWQMHVWSNNSITTKQLWFSTVALAGVRRVLPWLHPYVRVWFWLRAIVTQPYVLIWYVTVSMFVPYVMTKATTGSGLAFCTRIQPRAYAHARSCPSVWVFAQHMRTTPIPPARALSSQPKAIVGVK